MGYAQQRTASLSMENKKNYTDEPKHSFLVKRSNEDSTKNHT